MSVGQNFERLCEEVRNYVVLKSDDVKMAVVEELSLFFSDALSWLVILLFALLSFVCLLAAGIIVLASKIGSVLALAFAAAMLFVIALLFFSVRRRLFADILVRRLCRVFFREREQYEE